VAPAQQRLYGRDGTALEVDDGLVLQSEVISLDGTLELCPKIDGVSREPRTSRV